MPKMPLRILLLAFHASCLMASNITVNSGFETGDFTGWIASGWFIDTSTPNTGVYDASTGCGGAICTSPADPNAAYIYQDVTTVPGATYNLAFFYDSGDLPTQGTELLVQWGDPSATSLATVADFVNVDTSGAYVSFAGTVLATSATSRLEFFGRQDLAEYFVDDISLAPQSSQVPEPGSFALVVGVVLGFALRRLARLQKRTIPWVAGAMMLGMALPADAITVTYALSASFDDGGSAGGSFTVDTVTGVISAVNISSSPGLILDPVPVGFFYSSIIFPAGSYSQPSTGDGDTVANFSGSPGLFRFTDQRIDNRFQANLTTRQLSIIFQVLNPQTGAVSCGGQTEVYSPAFNFTPQTAYRHITSCSLSLTTVGVPPPQQANGLGNGVLAKLCPCWAGNPIDVSTGNKYEAVPDYTTTGANLLAFSRFYNSRASGQTYATRLGANWRSTFDRYVNIQSATSVIVERQDGQQVTFTLSGSTWTTDSDLDIKLTFDGSVWTFVDGNDTVETFTPVNAGEAMLTSIQLRNGYQQTLHYDSNNALTSVTDSYNRQLTFTYQNGLLSTLTTPDGLILTYGYESIGSTALLTTVTYSTSPATSQTYLYENAQVPFALTGIIDENGNRYATWTYDIYGRGLTSQHAGGADLTTIAYNDSDGSRTVTNALGVQEVYKFATLQGIPKVMEIDRLATATTAAATRRFTYDSNGYVASQTDWNGNLTTYVNDVHGQPTTITEASGTAQARTTTITYHASFHLPLQIVTPGLTTTFAYDASGNLLTKTLADTTATVAPYVTKGQTRTWTYTWANSLLATVKGPRTDASQLTTFTYDSSGTLTKTTNALNQATQVTQHLPGGLPQTVVDPNGVTTTLAYDARLRLTSSTLSTTAGSLATSYGYDTAGNLLSVTLPDGSALTNGYDAAHRLTGVTDVFGQSIAYSLDALGDRTQTNTLDANSVLKRQRSGGFDALGQPLRDIGGVGQTTGRTFDSNGNVLTVTDPLGHVTQQAFDALNRIIRTIDPAGGITKFVYDPHDRPLTVIDPNAGSTTYIYDGFGDLIQQVSPDTGRTIYRYDAAGNLVQKVDATGATANYSYDSLDRVIAVTYPADTAENIGYRYDEAGHGFGVGRLTSLTDAAGTLSRSYDERGNVLSETRARGAVTLHTAYTYDAASRLVSTVYPSGQTVSRTRDAMGRVTSVTAKAPGSAPVLPVASTARYLPFGPVSGLTFGNGIAETRAFDLDYRLTNLAGAAASTVQNLTYGYDAADNVASITDAATPANSQSFGYDALNRLTSAAGGYGPLGYTYNSVGNRLTQTAGTATTTYSYLAHSNQLSSLTTGAITQTVGYTAAGNISSFNPGGGTPVSAYAYNQAGRLATATLGGQPLTGYTYDAFGQRALKVSASLGTTFFQYDRDGHLLEEADASGNAIVDYIYLDDRPIATIEASSGKLYFLHDDRLGTPQLQTDSTGAATWVANYQPFGTLNTATSQTATRNQNLRFPGQELDFDTGLYHNGFRDYVPGWGRYLESDLIGLGGGMNTYGYAEGNPLNRSDPFGLSCSCTSDNPDDFQTRWKSAFQRAEHFVDIGEAVRDILPNTIRGNIALDFAYSNAILKSYNANGLFADRLAAAAASDLIAPLIVTFYYKEIVASIAATVDASVLYIVDKASGRNELPLINTRCHN
jgi:RHS repeat-associated protein